MPKVKPLKNITKRNDNYVKKTSDPKSYAIGLTSLDNYTIGHFSQVMSVAQRSAQSASSLSLITAHKMGVLNDQMCKTPNTRI